MRTDIENLVKDRGMTVFLTTHNLNEAEKLCSKVAVINKGKMISCGHPEELRIKSSKSRTIIKGRNFPENLTVLVSVIKEIAGFNLTDGELSVDFTDISATHKLVSLLVNSGTEIDEVVKERIHFRGGLPQTSGGRKC